MTKINLLNDITQKTKAPKKRRSLFLDIIPSVFKSKKAATVPLTPPSSKPISEGNGRAVPPPSSPSRAPVLAHPAKKRSEPSRLTALLMFLIPIVACVLLEMEMEGWIAESVDKMTARLENQASEFKASFAQPPPIDVWETRYQNISEANATLSRFIPLDIQVSIEYIRQATDSLPKEAWIQRVLITRNSESGTHQVEVEGFAFTSETVLLFLAQLKEQPLFTTVDLKFSEPTTENGIEEHRFRMSAINSQLDINALDLTRSSWLYNKLYPIAWRMP